MKRRYWIAVCKPRKSRSALPITDTHGCVMLGGTRAKCLARGRKALPAYVQACRGNKFRKVSEWHVMAAQVCL